ncbi:zincin-like metallopeptidase toxin domain-containing protein, partial [Paenibacillus sp. NPDC058174]|uniref:zincin-like metallopeptidase toxin domain-containing protein n=1 Tax=Paenibacillus sp. NPDC058174 TaxID=3346366 RepID=UPI0036DD38A8
GSKLRGLKDMFSLPLGKQFAPAGGPPIPSKFHLDDIADGNVSKIDKAVREQQKKNLADGMYSGTKKVDPGDVKVNKGPEGSTKGGSNLDLAEWDTKRVSGNVFKIDKYGNRKIRSSDFKKFKKDMKKEGIEVVIDKVKVPKDKAGGFDPETGIMYFREKPSQIAAFHESIHAKQWLELGKEKYLKQSTLEREEHVYKIIMENTKQFTRAEIIATERYIYKLRNNGQPAPFGWPPSNSDIFKGCLDE